MRTDDERLEKSRKAIVERIAKLNALMLTVIKGHLIIEQAMDSFLEACLLYPEHVRENRFNFSHKAHMCRSLGLNENEDDLWSVLWAVNALRNQIAHSLRPVEIQDSTRSLFVIQTLDGTIRFD
jgi:hypothetical protein